MLSGRFSNPAPATRQRQQRCSVVANAATTSSVRLRSLSQDLKDARRSLEEDEQLKVTGCSYQVFDQRVVSHGWSMLAVAVMVKLPGCRLPSVFNDSCLQCQEQPTLTANVCS
jgi:hypothetical protein